MNCASSPALSLTVIQWWAGGETEILFSSSKFKPAYFLLRILQWPLVSSSLPSLTPPEWGQRVDMVLLKSSIQITSFLSFIVTLYLIAMRNHPKAALWRWKSSSLQSCFKFSVPSVPTFKILSQVCKIPWLSLEIWLILGLGQEIYTMKQDHNIGPGRKEVFSKRRRRQIN